MRRRLTLSRETLAELTRDDLATVAGGSHVCPETNGCNPSWDLPCPTLPIYPCLSLDRPCIQTR